MTQRQDGHGFVFELGGSPFAIGSGIFLLAVSVGLIALGYAFREQEWGAVVPAAFGVAMSVVALSILGSRERFVVEPTHNRLEVTTRRIGRSKTAVIPLDRCREVRMVVTHHTEWQEHRHVTMARATVLLVCPSGKHTLVESAPLEKGRALARGLATHLALPLESVTAPSESLAYQPMRLRVLVALTFILVVSAVLARILNLI